MVCLGRWRWGRLGVIKYSTLISFVRILFLGLLPCFCIRVCFAVIGVDGARVFVCARVCVRVKYGCTATKRASSKGYEGCVQLLVAAGADVDQCSEVR